jgi:accessory gene regulator protein AgrB
LLQHQESKKCKRALELEKYDWGSYKLHPVTGKKAVRLAKLGIIWANILFWGIVLIVLIDVMKSLIRWWLP